LQFKNITGQAEIKRRLIQTVHENRVSHAQLFHGPEGSRKLAMAIAYAQFINCRNRTYGSGPDEIGDACGTCPSCIKFSKLIHPDLHFIFPVVKTKEIDKDPMSRDFLKPWRETLLENDFRLGLNDWYKAAGFEKKQGIINADDCSEILRTLSYKSYESEFKVMIIWMADRLYHSAAPKILKILEEPPDKSLFILITENPEKIINTILSRTQAVKFSRLRDNDIMMELTGKYGCSEEEAIRIMPLSDGNLTRAVKILKNDEDELFFLEKFVTWMRLCYKNDLKNNMEFIAEIAKIGREKQKNFLAYSERIVRNALLINYKNPHLAKLNKEEKEFMLKFGRFINYTNIVRFTEELEKAQYYIDRNANPSILFMDLSMTITILLLTGEKAVAKSQSS
jgi:DNA polymerase III subunit delta'